MQISAACTSKPASGVCKVHGGDRQISSAGKGAAFAGGLKCPPGGRRFGILREIAAVKMHSRGWRHALNIEDRVCANLYTSMGFARCSFMPASRDFFRSSSKVFAVRATMGIFDFSLSGSFLIVLAAS